MNPLPRAQEDAPSAADRPGSPPARPPEEQTDALPRMWVVAVVIVAGAAACLLLAGRGWAGMALVIAIQVSALAYILRASSWPPAAPRSAAVSVEPSPASSALNDDAADDDRDHPAG